MYFERLRRAIQRQKNLLFTPLQNLRKKLKSMVLEQNLKIDLSYGFQCDLAIYPDDDING
jgi:hypothetical protein